jgi:Ca-activated chloride channel family protein
MRTELCRFQRIVLCCAGALVAALGAAAEESLLVEVPFAPVEPQTVRPADVAVETGKGALEVVAIEPVEEWRIVVVVDTLLSDTTLVRSAVLDLRALTGQLVAAGSVEVVLAGEDTTIAIPPTRDAVQLEESLGWIRFRERGRAEQLAIRRRFVEEFELQSLVDDPEAIVSATAGQRIAQISAGVGEALAAEAEAVERQRAALLRWLLEQRTERPTVLVLVTGGADPVEPEFYRSALAAAGIAEAAQGVAAPGPRLELEDLARTLAVLGWPTLVHSPEGAALLSGSEEDDSADEEEDVETVVQDGQLVDRTMLGRIDPRDLLRRKDGRRAQLEPRLLEPGSGLALLAAATGGDLSRDREALREALSSLDRRLRVRVSRLGAGWESEPIVARWQRADERQGLELRSSRWIAAGLPGVAAQERALMILDGGLEEGELAVGAQLLPEGDASRLVLEVEGLSRAAAQGSTLRLTLATYEGDEARFEQTFVAPEATESVEAAPLRVEARVVTKPSPLAPLVVVVEEPDSGRWGAAFPSLSDSDGGPGLRLPTPRAIHLLEPEATIVYGPTLLEVVYDPQVAAVEYLVDGEIAARVSAPPFAVRVDLGALPEPRRIEAVAYGRDDRELARDLLVVNDSGTTLRVRILNPQPAAAAPDRQPLVGPVEVEAQVEVPRGEKLNRLEFYWNQELVATRFAPPFSQWISIPEAQPKGFVRVVGFLEDETSAEDVLFINSPGASERIRVELVQLFAVVTDGDGRPVRGVEAERFEIFEDDERQDLATFSEGADQPLTVGLAVDASASMFRKLPQVKQAAASFLRSLDGDKDRAFVVDFGREPRLQHDLSRDLGAVEEAVLALEAEGRTAIWKGITFGLVQLQGVQGKKALIVFSDGADEDPDFSFRTCLQFARRVGVPVYVIVSNNEIYRTGGRGLNVRGFMHRLESLTRSVGGRVFLTRVGEDLDAIYAEIDEELRSQYVLGYYARDRGESRWRSLRVEVDAPGARVRTAAGYFR